MIIDQSFVSNPSPPSRLQPVGKRSYIHHGSSNFQITLSSSITDPEPWCPCIIAILKRVTALTHYIPLPLYGIFCLTSGKETIASLPFCPLCPYLLECLYIYIPIFEDHYYMCITSRQYHQMLYRSAQVFSVVLHEQLSASLRIPLTSFKKISVLLYHYKTTYIGSQDRFNDRNPLHTNQPDSVTDSNEYYGPVCFSFKFCYRTLWLYTFFSLLISHWIKTTLLH